MRIISTDKAPQALGPYSQGVFGSGMCFVSMELGIDPVTGRLVSGDVGDQTRTAMRNAINIVEACGLEARDIVKITLYVVDLSEFGDINRVYSEVLDPPYPSRSLVTVKDLPLGAKIAVDAIAAER